MDQHLDAERLAAFADGTLTRAERAAVEAHAADCADCLQLLAAMTRTEPPLARAGWRLPAWRWAVPIAAGATAVALWVNVSRQPPVDESQASQAETRTAAPADAAAPTAAPAPAPPESRFEVQEKRADNRNRVDAERDAPSSAATAKAPPAPARTGRSDERDALSDKQQKPLAEEVPVRKEFGAVAQAPPPPAPQPVATPPPVAELPAATPQPTAEAVALDSTARTEQLRPSARLASVAAVISSDPMFRWRWSGSVIERSTDGGKIWTVSTMIPNIRLAAGSAPAPAVAWLVGAGGVVLTTADGKEWRRVTFPETADLISVTATSAREATVTTADGRVFRTSDGGGSWSAQEIGPSPF